MNLNYPKTKILWLLCTGIVSYFCFYVANVYLLHQISMEEFGNFAVSLKVLAIISTFITVSKQLSLSLYMPQYEKSHRHIQKSGVILWLSKNLFLAALILVIGIAFTGLAIQMMRNEIFVSVFQHHPWQFILFFIPISTFMIVLSCLLLSQKERIYTLAPFITIIPSLLIITIFALGIYIFNLSSGSVIFAYFICQSIIITLYLFLTHNYYVPFFVSNVSTDEHRQWYTYSHTYWIGTLSNQLATLLSLIALAYLSPVEYVGGYAIILLFVASYVALISPLHTYLASQLKLLLHTHSARLNRIIQIILQIQVFVVLFCVSIAIIAGKPLLLQINPQAVSLYSKLIFAMIMFGISITTTIPLRIVLHTALPDVGIYLKVSRFFLSCILLFLLIPRYGIVGAIISDTIPSIIINAIALAMCKKNLNLHIKLI